MNETQRNIKAYKEALPGIRERVVAMAMLLVMSLVMMSSATYAWLVISYRPEVTGANTTVAANGNLEIALAGRMMTMGELYPDLFPEGTDAGIIWLLSLSLLRSPRWVTPWPRKARLWRRPT